MNSNFFFCSKIFSTFNNFFFYFRFEEENFRNEDESSERIDAFQPSSGSLFSKQSKNHHFVEHEENQNNQNQHEDQNEHQIHQQSIQNRSSLFPNLARKSLRFSTNDESSTFSKNSTNNNSLISVASLEPHYRNVFPFDHFNKIQSAVFQTVYKSDNNVCISG